MWDPERVTLTIQVDVNLDGVPGTFHTKESAKDVVEHILDQRLKELIPHYHPAVRV